MKNETPNRIQRVRSAVPRFSRSSSICRKRTMGPATSCENSETYVENSHRFFVGLMTPR